MTPINLSELDYDKIRASLVEYLKKQDTVKDLNFEGSAVNFLLDILAYNAFYYAYFANMIASESFLDSAQLEKSIVSLVKPLGYVLPTKTSATTRIKLQNVTSVSVIDPYTVSVYGVTPEGLRYQFWNIDSIAVGGSSAPSGETPYFTMYEGVKTELSYGGDGFDYPEQRIFIPDLNMDIKTLRVSVKRTTDEIYNYWTRVDTYSGAFIEPTSNLYSLERTTAGFIVKFQTTSSSTSNLVSGDKVNIQYISSNGANANASSTFYPVIVPSGSNIVNIQPATGGRNSPDLDEARRIAPSVFSAQQRLVTKSDYYGFLSQMGFTNINVWGGEENSPPIYGRLLFTAADIATANNSIINDAIAKIKERSVVTVLPEYIPPRAMVVNFILNTQYGSNATTDPTTAINGIINDLEAMHPIGSFNSSLTYDTVKSTVESYTGYNIYSIQDLSLQYTILPSTRTTTLNFKNSIKKGTDSTSGVGVISSKFESSYYPQGTVQIRDVPILYTNTATGTNPPSIGKLKLYGIPQGSDNASEDLNATVGEVNYKQGTVTVYPNLSIDSFDIKITPVITTLINSQDEVYLKLNITGTTPVAR
jgi:hypothetical protein